MYETATDDDEDLDLVMPMYNLMEYSSSYFEAPGSWWLYSKDEATNINADIVNDDYFKHFKYKTKLFGSTSAQPTPNVANGVMTNAEIDVSLKCLSNLCNI